MTRFLALLSCLILMICLCTGVSAAESSGTRAYAINVLATVSNDGTCDVSSTVTLHVDANQKNLTYPVPLNASNVTLNGKPVLTSKTDQARQVNLSRVLNGMSGDVSFSVGYTVHSAVDVVTFENATAATDTEQGKTKRLRLELPMLAGFAYPIDELQFSINLPGVINQNPSFVSGYHQANIEKDLTYSISGGNIAGRSWTGLKDHETLTMYLDATEEMFPQTQAALPVVENVMSLIGICAGIAFAFWVLFLRNYLPLRRFPAVAPDGFGAGQLGTLLTMSGADLSMMVLSWAQLGYVSLHMDRRSHILIQKQMDMGNERTVFEQKYFHQLFSTRTAIDTRSSAYQRILQAVALQRSAPQMFRQKNPGAVKIFRAIMAAAGLLCGACFGIILGNMLDYGWVFMIILAVAGLFCSWHIQFWTEGLFLRHRQRVWTSMILSLLWLALGIAIGQFSLALLAVGMQLAAGFLATFGGRRTEEGRNAMGQALSLRWYLKRMTTAQLQQLSRDNPELFFDLIPFAIALGCDGALARRFGQSRLPDCPYLHANNTRGMTAKQWSHKLRYVLECMSAQKKRQPLDGLRSVMKNYMK